ncbi:GGDEF domain-containing protein [Chitinimonas sp. BJYL2]|uniref:GGDEF domain-containing protein n=1 Tax=Chitinimonas sp. BJYL2 TaxID=2976696 RepID=UPI0022B33F02|nr:GGDEF domain-containing protein [Chitinimonas sp. BJYL2]
MADSELLYQRTAYFLAQTFFIKDNREELLQCAHKYDFEIAFFDQLADFVDQLHHASDDDLYVIDLDVLNNMQTESNRTMFLGDLLKRLPAGREYVYLQTARQSGRFLLQRTLVENNCLAYAEKPIANDVLIDKLFNLFARKRSPERSRVVYLGDRHAFDTGMLREAAVEVFPHEDAQTLHQMVKQHRPDVVIIDDTFFMRTPVVAQVLKKNIEVDPSMEIVLLQGKPDALVSRQGIESGFDEIMLLKDRDILTRQMLNRLLKTRVNKNLISRDRATGLLNKVGFQRRAQETIRQAAAAGVPLSLAVIDIDKFKTINDTWGHYFGDIVIKRLSLLLDAHVGADDLLSRFGGEEFVLLLWNCDGAAAHQRMDAMRLAFGQLGFEVAAGDMRQFSFSGGVASYPQFQTESTLFLQADAMLYEAKQGGRNRICR